MQYAPARTGGASSLQGGRAKVPHGKPARHKPQHSPPRSIMPSIARWIKPGLDCSASLNLRASNISLGEISNSVADSLFPSEKCWLSDWVLTSPRSCAWGGGGHNSTLPNPCPVGGRPLTLGAKFKRGVWVSPHVGGWNAQGEPVKT